MHFGTASMPHRPGVRVVRGGGQNAWEKPPFVGGSSCNPLRSRGAKTCLRNLFRLGLEWGWLLTDRLRNG